MIDGRDRTAFRPINLALIATLLLVPTTLAVPRIPAKATVGVVTRRISGCDYFIVYTKTGFDVLEWFGGHDPDKDDVLIGSYESYGFHDVHDDTADESIRVWTEDYALSKVDALEKLTDSCE
jgi:hypothetical protein